MKDMQLCHLPVQFNTDNTDNWKDTKLPHFQELVDFSVSYWYLMLYRKTRVIFPEDFKSLESIQIKIEFCLRNEYVTDFARTRLITAYSAYKKNSANRKKNRPRRDLNPCRRLERAMS